MTNKLDKGFMEQALFLASTKVGLTYPNPAVGCVIVNADKVVGIGVTAVGGRPHAETQAIAMAKGKTVGATAYVTLEPCANECNSPSCAKQLVKAQISRCIIATLDKDPRTNGRGAEILKSAGISVETGLLQEKSLYINRGFFNKIIHNRPLFCAKIATSVDGKIALFNGKSKWITHSLSRKYAHYLRATHDCIIVGSQTVIKDNPTLNCRIAGMTKQSPIRVVLGKNIPATSTVLNDGNKTYVLSGDVNEIAVKLAEMGVTRCLIEGGGETIARFFRAGLVDRLALFNANNIIGADGLDCIGDLAIDDMDKTAKYKMLFSKQFNCDTFRLYEKV